ncbi:MAG: succinylglutamate desuccinylase/aspartoacylase family protein, partial [Cyanobium sp.]
MATAAAAAGFGPGGSGKVLVVAGTHGNERNGPWLLQQPSLASVGGAAGAFAHAGLAVVPVIGNPAAFAANSRYLDRDLNRSFEPALLAEPQRPEAEVERARALISSHGPQGREPCLVALDLH